MLQLLDYDQSYNQLVRGILALCLRQIYEPISKDICMKCISNFTESCDSREKMDIWPFLIKKGKIVSQQTTYE